MGYAAEEVGLLGSREIAEKFRREETTVVGTLQLDMTMFPGGSPKISFITDFVDADLTRFTQRLVDSHVRAPWVEGKCGYACSDHASWNRVGYASAFPFEAPPGKRNQKIHTPRDTHDRLSASHGVTFLKLALAFAIELGLE
jgi:leucyl aminopeptidase